MRVSGRRGQAGTEYLMTYGWAMIIIFIVGLVLWKLGVFSTDKVDNAKGQGFTKLRPHLAVVDYSSEGVFQSVFLNGAGNPIRIYGVVLRNAKDDNAKICCSSASFDPDADGLCTSGASNISGADYTGFPASYNPIPEPPAPQGPLVDKSDNFQMFMGATSSTTPAGKAASTCAINDAREGRSYELLVEIYYKTRLGSSWVDMKESGIIEGKIS